MKTLHDGTEVSLDTPTKLVNGKRYLLTQDEIDAREAEAAAVLKERPLHEWKQQMAKTDEKMPRYLEDVIDVLTSEQKQALVQETLTRYTEKKQLRSKKPTE